MIVLDASAVLAHLFDEPGGRALGPGLGPSLISAVNFAEVLSRLARDGLTPDLVMAALSGAEFDVVAFDESQAALAASLVAAARPLGLSLADRCCLALGLARDLPILTADRAWTELDTDLEIRLIR